MRRSTYLALLIAGCGDPASVPDDTSTPDSAVVTGCQLTANTTPTSTITNNCTLVTRDASSCEADRRALGLEGFWLKFSCRVTITLPTPTTVQLLSDSRPDHLSNYFPTGDVCHTDYTPAQHNPNMIVLKHMTMTVPRTPTAGGPAMGLGTIGFAVNGVALFDNTAAPGDDIYVESRGFDECQGHPNGQQLYHYHSEPYSISDDDANLIGVVMDGYPVYGRRDVDGTVPTLDANGGHTSPTPDSATPVYHYHINLQTSTATGTAGQQEWFITSGHYAGVPGTCAGC